MANLTDHNVVGTFSDMDAARKAILALGRAGIESDDVSVLGRELDEVASDPDTRLRDLEATADVAKKAAVGGAAGSVLGAIAGAAAFVIPGVGPAIGSGIWAGVAAGVAAGGAVGGMVGAVGGLELGEAWEVTYGDSLRAGKVLVAVHAADGEQSKAAESMLREEGAESVDHLDAEGRPAGEG